MAGTVPSSKNLVDGTVPSSKNLVDGTVPSSKNLVDGTPKKFAKFKIKFKSTLGWCGRPGTKNFGTPIGVSGN